MELSRKYMEVGGTGIPTKIKIKNDQIAFGS